MECGVVIGNTNKGATPKKTAKLVKKVAILKDEYPDLIDPLIKTIGLFARKGEMLLDQKDYISLGRLMNINHGLLDALGVCTSELSSLVYAARNAGAYGAKITGAGGGGCMVAITDSQEEVASAIEAAGGQAIITKFTSQGVVSE
jgi:mevalonate kinase